MKRRNPSELHSIPKKIFGSYRHLKELLKYEEKEAAQLFSVPRKLFGNYRHLKELYILIVR